MKDSTGTTSGAGRGGVVFAALMPHAPVLVPGVGRERLAEVARTGAALREASARLLRAQPDLVVLISPHSPRRPGAFGLWEMERLAGSLTRFGDEASQIRLPVNSDFIQALKTETPARGIELWSIPEWQPLDHGIVVPLWFVQQAGWNGHTIVLGLNHPGEGLLVELGQVIARVAESLHKRVAIIASGDMSHRLQPGAPAGYEPRAREFDHAFIELVRAGDFRALPRMEPALQELAAEDVVDSCVIACAAAGWNASGHEVLSYEGPFGVGYGVAVFFDIAAGSATDSNLPGIARQSVEAALRGGQETPPAIQEDASSEARGVFVTLRDAAGELRGCVGTLAPKYRTIAEEAWHMARSAAFHDGRFTPVESRELSSLRFEVSVLEPLEFVANEGELDPAKYGVVVSTDDGRRGVLLPAIAGIRTTGEQVEIARRKGGIEPAETVRLQRFRVNKFKEQGFVEAGD